MGASVNVGDRVRLLVPLTDGYIGTGRVVAAGDELVRLRRDDNCHEAVARRDEVARVSEARRRARSP